MRSPAAALVGCAAGLGDARDGDGTAAAAAEGPGNGMRGVAESVGPCRIKVSPSTPKKNTERAWMAAGDAGGKQGGCPEFYGNEGGAGVED